MGMWEPNDEDSKASRNFFMSLCSGIGMIGMLISTLGIEPERLEPRTVWNGRDVVPRLAILWEWDGKVQERMSVVKVVKKDKGTVITVRSYVSGFSRDLLYKAEFTSDSYERWQRKALCWHRNRLGRSETGESERGWGPV